MTTKKAHLRGLVRGRAHIFTDGVIMTMRVGELASIRAVHDIDDGCRMMGTNESVWRTKGGKE